jgi:hypothetical protein
MLWVGSCGIAYGGGGRAWLWRTCWQAARWQQAGRVQSAEYECAPWCTTVVRAQKALAAAALTLYQLLGFGVWY